VSSGKQQETPREYTGYRAPGIRLNEAEAPLVDPPTRGNFLEMVDAIHWFDKAHLVMLVEEALIDRTAGVAMLRALRDLEPDNVVAARLEAGGATHSGENYLIRALGEDVGGRLHLGRSSGDLAEIGLRVTMRRHLLEVLDRLCRLRRVIAQQIPAYTVAVMPGYTHGQQAQPTTYGHWLAMWAHVFARDTSRLLQLYRRVDLSPAGAAIMTGSDVPLNRRRVSDLMGFAAPIPNTLDAIHSHDLQIEYAMALATFANNAGRLAEDVLLWASAEFGFIRVPDRFCGTSSIMMQKRNPLAPQAAKAIAAVATGTVTTACMAFKGTTGLPILERGYVESQLWSLSTSVARSLGWWIDLLPSLVVDRERMQQAAGAHFAQATDLASALVRERDLPWRTAHQIVGILCRFADERGVTPDGVTSELLDEAAAAYGTGPLSLGERELRDALDASKFPLRRTLFGGPGPEAVAVELTDIEQGIRADEADVHAAREALHHARQLLEGAIDELLGEPAHTERTSGD